MKTKMSRIMFWNRENDELKKSVCKRRQIDVVKFTYRDIHYIFFKNNLKKTYSLVGKCKTINPRNYLLAHEPMEDIKNISSIKIANKLQDYLKAKNFGKKEFREYLNI